MRDKLEKYREQVKDHMQKAQHKQKVWYDRHARERELKTGQKVLVLLPSGPSKLLAKWQGPYTVIKRAGPVTYEIACPEKQKSKQLLHVNLLKEYHERNVPEMDVKQTLMVQDIQPEDSAMLMDGEAEMSPCRKLAKSEEAPKHLTPDQWQQLALQDSPTDDGTTETGGPDNAGNGSDRAIKKVLTFPSHLLFKWMLQMLVLEQCSLREKLVKKNLSFS
ncbi:uncharacterized protein LOC119795417 isoform X2 [Cyprinodon tularosa]|uniref:uncharacterized protein LOC119771408 isoform X2 n=1 Tax=Cyprinodon tularosa TaxID=77115 RepID=UPI0018E275A3|nr:uncharacterized protein LOC119771408 isoform X2 [Cyprinodon tularosa]XP_038159364.1 uncharacterized protein LOC119795417 isoform X2 [Cyprinodon tularosa]